MDLVPYAVPIFFILIGVEFYYGIKRGQNTYRVNDALNSLSLGLINTLSKLVVLNVGALVFARLASDTIFIFDMNNAVHWAAAIVLYDFLYYWFHRISHERKIFWAAHVVHHQSEEYNLTTALRQTGTGFLISWVFYLPCFLLGMPVEMFTTIASAHLIYQFWIHTRHIPKLGNAFELVFVSPSNHRVHHGSNARYLDKNHGGLFIVWDRMFGTFQEELDQEPVRYGLTTPLATWNPIEANIRVYKEIYDDISFSPNLRSKLSCLLARTAWRADASLCQSESSNAVYEKYNPVCPKRVGHCCIVLFGLLGVINTATSLYANNLPHIELLSLAIYQLLSVMTIAALLEQTKHLRALEISRVLLATLGLTYLFTEATLSPLVAAVATAVIVLSTLVTWYAEQQYARA